MNHDEKRAFANEAEKALAHPLVKGVMEEFADNMGFELKGLPRYGLAKVAHYAASIARAQALGIDPEDLRSTPQETTEHQMRLAEKAIEAGVPTTIIVTPPADADSHDA